MNTLPAGPMDMGDIVAGAWNIYRRAPATWLAITLVGLVVVFAVRWLAGANLELDAEPTGDALRDALPWISGVFLASVVVDVFTYIALVAAAAAVLRGSPISVQDAYATGARLFLPALLVVIVIGGFIGLLFMTLILIPLAIFLAVCWSLLIQVMVVEEEKPFPALGRSRQIVRGQWWRTFGILLAIVLLAFLPEFAIGQLTSLADAVWATAAGSAVAGALAAPFQALAVTLLYADLRIRKGERPFLSPVGATP